MIRNVKLVTDNDASDCFDCKFGYFSSFPSEVAYMCIHEPSIEGKSCKNKIVDEPGMFDRPDVIMEVNRM